PAALTHDAASHASDAEFADVLALHDALLDEMVAPAVMGAALVEERDRRRLVLARLGIRGAAAAQGGASALQTSPPEPAALELCGLLERAGAQRGVPGLEVALAHPAPHVRQEALKALLRIASPESARQRALAALDGSDPVARRVALDQVVAG